MKAWIARHGTSGLRVCGGEPYIVLSCRSENSRPNASTASNVVAVSALAIPKYRTRRRAQTTYAARASD